MNKRQLPRIGLGCWPLAGGYGEVDIDQARRTVDAAFASGWSLFDTAEAYGDSELILGKLLGGRPRDSFFLATKAFPCEPYTTENLNAALAASLTRLNMDYVDLYQLHGPENWLVDQETPVEIVAEAFERLRFSERTRHLGVCNFTVDGLDQLVRHTAVFSIQNLYGMLDRTSESDMFQFAVEEELLPYVAGAGVNFIAYSPLGRGLLGEGMDPHREFSVTDERRFLPRYKTGVYEEYVALANRLANWANDHGRSLPYLAVAWVLRDSRVSSVLVGAKNPEQVEAIAGADTWELRPAEVAEIETILRTLPEPAKSAPATVLDYLPPDRAAYLRARRYGEVEDKPIVFVESTPDHSAEHARGSTGG